METLFEKTCYAVKFALRDDLDRLKPVSRDVRHNSKQGQPWSLVEAQCDVIDRLRNSVVLVACLAFVDISVSLSPCSRSRRCM